MRLASFLFFLSAGAFASADISFQWPVDCVQGRDCYIQNYVDQDSSEGHRDFTCGALSYDGHKGTDIALYTLDRLADGVAVLAASDGVVLGRRDGMDDALFTGEDLDGRDCGNGVVIDHGQGWVTQYCHLRKGTILVGRGAEVKAGTKLGEIGLSGRTQFPHLHFSVRRNDQTVDPFAPETLGTCGVQPDETLWADQPRYTASGLLNAGFSTQVPAYDDVKAGTALRQPERNSPLVFFGFAFGGQIGDVMRITIEGPRGRVFQNDAEITRTRAQLFRAGGKRAPDGGWARGSYTGIVELRRAGQTISILSAATEIP